LFAPIATSLYFVRSGAAKAQFWVAGDDTGSDCASLLSVLFSKAAHFLRAALVQIGLDINGASWCRKTSPQKCLCYRSVVVALYILVDLLSIPHTDPSFFNELRHIFRLKVPIGDSANFSKWGMVNIWSAPMNRDRAA